MLVLIRHLRCPKPPFLFCLFLFLFFCFSQGPRAQLIDVASKVKQKLLGTFRKGSKRSQQIGRVFRRFALEQGLASIDSEVHVAVVRAVQSPIQLIKQSSKEEHAWGFPYSSSGHHGHAIAKRTGDYVAGLKESAHQALSAIPTFMHKHTREIKIKKDQTFEYHSPTGESITKLKASDGFSTALKLRDGTSIKRTETQTVFKRPNGSVLVAAADGSKLTETKADGTILVLDLAGTRFVMVRPNGAKTYRFEKRKLALEFKPDGTLLQCDGALGFVIHMSPPRSGFFTISFTYNDGTSVMWQSDGTSLQSCAVRKSKDGDLGDRNTQADHSVIERFADGRTIRRSVSGWTVETEADGTIVSATDPEGSVLDPASIQTHKDEELKQLLREGDRMEQPWHVVDSLTVNSSKTRSLRPISRPLGWPIWLMSGMLVQRSHLQNCFSDDIQLDKVWKSSTYGMEKISVKKALQAGAAQQRRNNGLGAMDDSTSSDDDFSFGADGAIDLDTRSSDVSSAGKKSKNQLSDSYTSSSDDSSSLTPSDYESSVLTPTDYESSELTPTDYESSVLTPSDSEEEEVKPTKAAAAAKSKPKDEPKAKGKALTLKEVYALRRRQRLKQYSSSSEDDSTSSGDDSWFMAMHGAKKHGKLKSRKRNNIDMAKQQLLRARMRKQRALAKKAKKESRQKRDAAGEPSDSWSSSSEGETTSSDEGVETWLLPQKSKGASGAKKRRKNRRHKIKGSHTGGADSSTDDDSTSSEGDGVEEWTMRKNANAIAGLSVHGRRQRRLNIALTMSGISASQMQRSDEMQEALKRAVGFMMQKSIKASSTPGGPSLMEVIPY